MEISHVIFLGYQLILLGIGGVSGMLTIKQLFFKKRMLGGFSFDYMNKICCPNCMKCLPKECSDKNGPYRNKTSYICKKCNHVTNIHFNNADGPGMYYSDIPTLSNSVLYRW